MISSKFKVGLWVLLSLPALYMIWTFTSGKTLLMDQLNLSGQISVKLMILALLPGPLISYFGQTKLLKFWISIRRNLGVSAFAYALLHLIIYIVDMRGLMPIVGDLGFPGIWTGWLALLFLIPPAAVSYTFAVRRLGRNWKRIQKLVYVAFGLTSVHWIILSWSFFLPFLHAAPVFVAWFLRRKSDYSSKKI